MKQIFLLLLSVIAWSTIGAQTTLHLTLHSAVEQEAAPIVVELAKYKMVTSARVEIDGQEVACQLDDLNRDGRLDELCFLADLKANQLRRATVTLYPTGAPRPYPARTYAEIVLRNPKVKEKNRQDIYLSTISIDRRTKDPYHLLHHHGMAFENELIALRIYMDQRQTIDLYGKYRQGLELQATQFYTSPEQKAEGYGDDVLWVGNTFGLGALRGWNGHEPTMLDSVEQRTQRIVSQGPVRTVVEMEDEGWTIRPGMQPVNMVIRYTLYAGHRDIDVDVRFSRDMTGVELSTGIINVKQSTEYSDHRGTRGCWGTDWPATDTINWKRETVGLGIHIPQRYRVSEMPANKDNYAYVVKPVGSRLHYCLTYTSANESYGFHSVEAWFDYLKAWTLRQQSPVIVSRK